MNGQHKVLKFIILLAVFISLAAVYAHISDNLLSYDEQHYSGQDIAFSTGGENEEQEPTWKIVVDLDRFSIYVYKDNMLIRTYPCSGGKSETPSPTGNFRIIKKEAWGEGFGGAWMGLDVPWGVFGIHGTKFPWIIGKKHASKGCIRMYTRDAKELAFMIPCGTPVKIIQKQAFRTFYTGDMGSQIWDAEVALHSLKYYDGAFDGKFGNKLYDAVKKFQNDQGLTVTGSLNKKTYDRLMETWEHSGGQE